MGRDETNTDYSTVGKSGGQSRVKLTVDQMPKHMHTDKGHSHSLKLNTESSGSHTHQYTDSYPYAVSNYYSISYTQNKYEDKTTTRTTESSGAHVHNVNGVSNSSCSDLNETGGDAEHENRPPFYVIQYIIYMPHQ